VSTTLRRNEAASRYEILDDGEVVGFADYRVAGDTVEFPHTEITPLRRGEGLGAELVGFALADVRRSGRRVVPLCWYVAQHVRDHPEDVDTTGAFQQRSTGVSRS
jgi:predicted GNAT family acetyltransferase